MQGTGVNRKVLTSLIESGSISFGYNKRTLIENLDNVINYADIAKDAGIIEVEKPYIEESPEYPKNLLTEMEVRTIGFYLTEHPVSKYREMSEINSINITEYFDKNVKIIVMISNIRETMTKNNDVMAFVLGSDEYGDIDLTIFPNTYKKFNKITKGNVIEVNGKVERRFDKYQVVVNYINILEDN
jgi:DNA polymerase-3 subunit alpha